jgi:hypothetical protein
MSHIKELIERYVLAKDQNKPYQMARVFTPDVKLSMDVLTQDITFPPIANGLTNVTDVVCSNLNRHFENIYTFCFTDPPVSPGESFSCGWMVVMSEKTGGVVRVGGGRYDWCFNPERTRVNALTITVSDMSYLPATTLPSVMEWVENLSYPWVSRETAELLSRDIRDLSEILLRLGAKS